jgi:hypothetical protein
MDQIAGATYKALMASENRSYRAAEMVADIKIGRPTSSRRSGQTRLQRAITVPHWPRFMGFESDSRMAQ